MSAALFGFFAEIFLHKAHAAESGLRVTHHAVESFAIAGAALFVFGKEFVELFVVVEVSNFADGARFAFDDSGGLEKSDDDLDFSERERGGFGQGFRCDWSIPTL